MSVRFEFASRIRRVLGRGAFPHEFAWLIDNPVRRLFITPETLVRRLDLASTAEVLEVGPGSGFFTVAIARAARSVTVMDIQPEMLLLTRKKAARAGVPNIRYAAANASGQLPFAGETFDAAVLVTVLGEVPQPDVCLRDLHRILRPSGRVAIHEHLPDPDFVRRSVLRRLSDAAGFSQVAQFGSGWNYTEVFEKRRLPVQA